MPTTSVVFSPELDERALDREVRQTNDAFADAASDLSADFDTNMGGVGGGGGVATGENAMLALADQRNDLLEELVETMDETFVGSSQEDGGGGGVGAPIIAGGGLGLGGAGGIGAVVGGGLVGLIQSQTDFFQRVQSAGDSVSQALGGLNTKRILGAMNLAGGFVPQLVQSVGAGLVSGFRGEGIFNVERAKQGFNEVFQTYQASNKQVISDLQNFFGGLSWPDLPEFSWPDAPDWVNPLTNWQFPKPPSWVRGLVDVFGGGGSGQSQTRPVISGTPDSQRDPTLARASRQNQAAQGGRGANVNNNVDISLDPQRVARELVPEVERQVQRGLDDLRRELNQGGARGSAPGARN